MRLGLLSMIQVVVVLAADTRAELALMVVDYWPLTSTGATAGATAEATAVVAARPLAPVICPSPPPLHVQKLAPH